MSEFLEEIKQDIRIEKVESFISKYGKISILFLVGLICSGVFFLWWQEHKKNQIYEEGALFISAMQDFESNAFDQALKKLKKNAQGTSHYGALSQLYLASMHSSKKEYDKAITFYDNIITNSHYDRDFRDHAKLAKLFLQLKLKSSSTENVLEDLDSYINKQGISKHTAQLLQAAVYLEKNDFAKAQPILQALLTDTSIYEGTRQIAELLMSSISS